MTAVQTFLLLASPCYGHGVDAVMREVPSDYGVIRSACDRDGPGGWGPAIGWIGRDGEACIPGETERLLRRQRLERYTDGEWDDNAEQVDVQVRGDCRLDLRRYAELSHHGRVPADMLAMMTGP